ncbi:MAG: glycosyltransferase [Candidatus Paceibacterota bacterium]
MTNKLAIVIPAYKADFLKETLDSLKSQTDHRFRLYIFDDASPYKIKEIVEGENIPVDVVYHRFDENLGQFSIVKQWERCISSVDDEEWIWLFSDDDLMDPNCVRSFYNALEKYPNSVAFRFNTDKIADHGELIRENRFSNEFDAVTFLNQKLTYNQESYVVETIFSREIHDKIGGIPDLPLAWASDDLFTVKLALSGKVHVIEDALVYWRYSDKNISGSVNKKSAIRKLKASRTFVKWIYKNQHLIQGLKPDDLAIKWYIRQIKTLQNQINIFNELAAVIRISGRDIRVWKLYLRLKRDRSKLIGWLKKYL